MTVPTPAFFALVAMRAPISFAALQLLPASTLSSFSIVDAEQIVVPDVSSIIWAYIFFPLRVTDKRGREGLPKIFFLTPRFLRVYRLILAVIRFILVFLGLKPFCD
jgi:hypothetical protein